MDRPVTIGKVHNISLENFSEEYPHLVAQFSCKPDLHDCIPVSAWKYDFDVCCAAVWLYDVYNVTVKGIITTVQSSNVSGVILRNVSNANVQLTTTYSLTDHECLGTAVYEGDSIEVQSSSANNCTYGLVLHNTTNSHINDVIAMYNRWGIVLLESDDSFISNTTVTNNSLEGMFLGSMNNVHINNTTAT